MHCYVEISGESLLICKNILFKCKTVHVGGIWPIQLKFWIGERNTESFLFASKIYPWICLCNTWKNYMLICHLHKERNWLIIISNNCLLSIFLEEKKNGWSNNIAGQMGWCVCVCSHALLFLKILVIRISQVYTHTQKGQNE